MCQALNNLPRGGLEGRTSNETFFVAPQFPGARPHEPCAIEMAKFYMAQPEVMGMEESGSNRWPAQHRTTMLQDEDAILRCMEASNAALQAGTSLASAVRAFYAELCKAYAINIDSEDL
jgi:hypothetical protein